MPERVLVRLLLACAVLCAAPSPAQIAPGRFVVGSKNFTESHVLGELLAQVVAAHTGLDVEHRSGLGGTPACLAAIRSGEIDAYPEYTGTGLAVLLGERSRITDPLEAFLRVQRASRERLQLEWLAPFGFENGYALAMREQQAAALGITTLSDLARHAGQLRGAFSVEFHDRQDGYRGLRGHYGLEFAAVRTIEHALAYDALTAGSADVVDVYTTDGRLAVLPLRVLRDDRTFFPPYHAAPVVHERALRRHPELHAALARLAFVLDAVTMQRLNAAAERSAGRVGDVVAAFLHERGLLAAEAARAAGGSGLVDFVGERLGSTLEALLQHLWLVAAAVLLAALVAVPLGIAVRERPRAERFVLGAAGVLQTIPALALLAVLVALPGFGLSAATAICALFLYGLLPIARNTVTGLRSVSPELLEVAAGIGLSPRQVLRYVQLPLAVPAILAGVRTATVIAIGGATLAAFVGAGGLGQPILEGLYLHDSRLVLAGALPAALLALVADWLLLQVERRLLPPRASANGR